MNSEMREKRGKSEGMKSKLRVAQKTFLCIAVKFSKSSFTKDRRETYLVHVDELSHLNLQEALLVFRDIA